MDQTILVLNAGSSSLKFAVFDARTVSSGGGAIARGRIEAIGGAARFTVEDLAAGAAPAEVECAPVRRHADALRAVLHWVLAWVRGRGAGARLVAVGHRVVHGGVHFGTPVRIDADVFARLEALVPLAPLHQPHSLAAIAALREIDPDLPQVACFDTAFHRSQPMLAQTFALPRALTEAGVRAYGFHGLSYEYVADALPDPLGAAAEGRVIVAHLGHGASLCALRGRRSVATTMSFTPLDGLPMATRCGALDPGVPLYLMRERGMTPDAVTNLLNTQSGLLGVSGISGDMRELLASDDPRAAEAIELFVYRAGRELGSLAAALGGLDALVFTGGIGEHAAVIRERICQRAAWLGVRVDPAANAAGGARISDADSPVSVWVIPTDEERVIARHAYRIAGA
ncbi:MAG: acetate/propionate family kinase [Pseudomonadota bacterium]